MKGRLKCCPVCGGRLKVRVLRCEDCGLELRNDFGSGAFDALDEEQTEFLMDFLRCRGNLRLVQEKLGLSYPAAKKKLDALLIELGLEAEEQEEKDIRLWKTDENSRKASEIIKTKLKQAGGRTTVHSARGLPIQIYVRSDGSFGSDKLPDNLRYDFRIFDLVTELLLASGGRARKGNGRNFKLGQPDCDESTVVGYLGVNYFGKKPGQSVIDPVFVLAAVLEWAGIAVNGRGELHLRADYKESLC